MSAIRRFSRRIPDYFQFRIQILNIPDNTINLVHNRLCENDLAARIADMGWRVFDNQNLVQIKPERQVCSLFGYVSSSAFVADHFKAPFRFLYGNPDAIFQDRACML